MESKTVNLGGTHITVRELTVMEIQKMTNMPESAGWVERIGFVLGECASIETDFLMSYPPSELQGLIDAMLEVNAAFFAQAAAVGMDGAAQALRRIIGAVSMIAFSSLSDQATE